VKRKLLWIGNRNAGLKRSEEAHRQLLQQLQTTCGDDLDAKMVIADDHKMVHRTAAAFRRTEGASKILVTGGGSGTLRAALEGIVEGGEDTLPDRAEMVVAPLRMGSGNLVSRRLGFSDHSASAVEQVAMALRTGSVQEGCIMRLEHGTASGKERRRYGATLGGLGVFGRVPSRVGVLNAQWARWVAWASKSWGIERANHLAYGAAMATECARSLFADSNQDRVQIRWGHAQWTGRLFAGALMNFPVEEMPLRPRGGLQTEGCDLFLLPWRRSFSHLGGFLHASVMKSQAIQIPVETGSPVTLTFDHPGARTIFIDEDPVEIRGRLTLDVAGHLPFLSPPNPRA
jgi:hypothetical protein